MELTIRDSIAKDVHDVCKNIREEDNAELEGLGYTAFKSLFYSYRHAVYRKTVLVNGEVAAMWGVCGTLLGKIFYPYFITSKAALKVSPLRFTRIYLQEFNKLKTSFPKMEQYVDEDYTGALRLLGMIGFTWNKNIRINGLNGKQYFHVTYGISPILSMQIETVEQAKNDIMKLADAHGEEFTYHKDIKGAVDPDWVTAKVLEDKNKLKIVTVREDGELLGYFIFVLSNLPHYQTVSIAYEDTFYLVPDKRGTKLGYKFLKFAVDEMKKTGAKVLRVANKTKADYETLWKRLGFEREEIVYTQVIT